MANVLVFGHQNPDNDAIMSAVVLSQLLNQVEYAGNTYEACALGQLPAESAKLLADAGIAEPRVIESVEAGQLVVLTDHNESAQSVAGLKDATVFGVVDHHRIGDFETAGPLHYICLPWGSSCTIVTKLAGVLGVELSDVQAKLLLSAMMTDTLMLKSPTTTDVDRAVAAKLGEQVGVDPVKFGMEVFLTRPSGSFTAAEMVGNDIKMFEPAGKKLLIGQYETVDKTRALGMIDEIREAMRAYAAEKGADGIVLCITDIMEEGSQVLLEGETEAAQKGLNIAPGLKRRFAAERYSFVPAAVWAEQRQKALADSKLDVGFEAFGYDIDPAAVALANANAKLAGVGDRCRFEVADVKDFAPRPSSIILTNPPYGERLGDAAEAAALARTLGQVWQASPTAGLYAITADADFEAHFGKKAAKRRKIYNGMIPCQIYMYFDRPVKPVRK